MALTENGNELLYGGAFTVHLAPDWAIEPYGTLGLGGLVDVSQLRPVRPEEGDRLGSSGRRGVLARAPPGESLVRLEASQSSRIFTEDSYRNAQIYQGGLGVYF